MTAWDWFCVAIWSLDAALFVVIYSEEKMAL
jgi:hypothetical protein